MSQDKKIQVDPQELRDLGTHFQHVSADIQQRPATAGLDTGAWTGAEAARLSARFAEAEAMGQRRAAAHAELGDRLCRAADAFEEADTTALQQLMGMPAGWMEPSPVVTGAGKTLNSTVLSTQLPAPASLLTTENGTGTGPDWEKLFRKILVGGILIPLLAWGVLGLFGNRLLSILITSIAIECLGLMLPHMTVEEFREALRLAIKVIPIPYLIALIVLGGLVSLLSPKGWVIVGIAIALLADVVIGGPMIGVLELVFIDWFYDWFPEADPEAPVISGNGFDWLPNLMDLQLHRWLPFPLRRQAPPLLTNLLDLWAGLSQDISIPQLP